MLARVFAVLALLLSDVRAFALELKNATIRFASAIEGGQILETRDGFVERMSPFDRSARMKTDRPVSEEEFLRFARQSVLDWTEAERNRLTTILVLLNARLREVPLALPAQMVLIKTNGNEEWEAAYTRENAIVLSQQKFAHVGDLERLICHELFHILSRHNPELREGLYATIGFTKCDEPVLPPEIESRRITNPDAPHNDHFIRVKVEGKNCVGMPILFSKSAAYDIQRGRELREYVEFRFLVAETVGDLSRAETASTGRRFVALEEVSELFEQVGRNTNYVIHPEEILADNFALLILRPGSARSPEILQKMKATLLQSQTPN